MAGSRKAVEEKRGNAVDKADVEARKEKARRVGYGVLEKQAQGGAGRTWLCRVGPWVLAFANAYVMIF